MPESRASLARSSFERGQRVRAQILAVLIVMVLGSAILAVAMGGRAWELHLAAEASLAAYVALLLEAKRRRRERAVKVRSIAQRRPIPRPQEQVVLLQTVDGRRA